MEHTRSSSSSSINSLNTGQDSSNFPDLQASEPISVAFSLGKSSSIPIDISNSIKRSSQNIQDLPFRPHSGSFDYQKASLKKEKEIQNLSTLQEISSSPKQKKSSSFAININNTNNTLLDQSISRTKNVEHGKSDSRLNNKKKEREKILKKKEQGDVIVSGVAATQALLPTANVNNKVVSFFSHLQPPNSLILDSYKLPSLPKNYTSIPVVILKLAAHMANGTISDSNDRCIGMLQAFKHVIRNYEVPSFEIMGRSLEHSLRPMINTLKAARPLSVSMGNAIRLFKHEIANIASEEDTEAAKEYLISWIDSFIQNKIFAADEIIASFALSKISDGDILMIFSRSCTILKTLHVAAVAGKKFSVVIVDSSPDYEGKKSLVSLSELGISIKYTCINYLSSALKRVSKIFLSAYAVFSNGSVMARIGSSLTAMTASSFNIPVIVLSESYKFSEKTQMDAFVYNELGDPLKLIMNEKSPLKNYSKADKSLDLLCPLFDIVPASLITMIITEVGNLPTTSIPVVIREYVKLGSASK